MSNPSQARDIIWAAVRARGGAEKVSALTADSGGKRSVSADTLYKFRYALRLLGRDSVNALAPHLTEVTAETWLAAMGVDQDQPTTPDATP